MSSARAGRSRWAMRRTSRRLRPPMKSLTRAGAPAPRPEAGAVAQALPLDEVHDRVGGALVEAEVGDRHAGRMGELAHRHRLALEPAQAILGGGVRVVEEIDG